MDFTTRPGHSNWLPPKSNVCPTVGVLFGSSCSSHYQLLFLSYLLPLTHNYSCVLSLRNPSGYLWSWSTLYLSCLAGLHPSVNLVVLGAQPTNHRLDWMSEPGSGGYAAVQPILSLPLYSPSLGLNTLTILWSSHPEAYPPLWRKTVFNPLFPLQEDVVVGPSIQYSLRRAQLGGRPDWLCQTAARIQLLADQHCTQAPNYQLGQEEWLLFWDLPLQGSPYVQYIENNPVLFSFINMLWTITVTLPLIWPFIASEEVIIHKGAGCLYLFM